MYVTEFYFNYKSKLISQQKLCATQKTYHFPIKQSLNYNQNISPQKMINLKNSSAVLDMKYHHSSMKIFICLVFS